MHKKVIETRNAPSPIGPYSQAISCHGMVYLSGQIALDSITGELVTSSIEAETKQVMENIKAILVEAGCSLDDVVKCSIFISDMGNFDKINEVYGAYFSNNPPARECVEVSVLPKNVNVEITAIAALP